MAGWRIISLLCDENPFFVSDAENDKLHGATRAHTDTDGSGVAIRKARKPRWKTRAGDLSEERNRDQEEEE